MTFSGDVNIMDIRAVILDMDGVLWRGSEQIGNLKKIFNILIKNKIQFVLATNNSTRTPQQYIEKLQNFGVLLSERQVVTSSQVAAEYLMSHLRLHKEVYVIGEDGLKAAIMNNGFVLEENNAYAVVAGMDHDFDYKKLSIANTLIRSGAIFVATNNDLTFPTPHGLAPGAGSIIAAIQASSGIAPVIMGKPEAEIFRICFDRLNINPENILVVGDRLETDIAGGQRVGCPTAMVLSGVTTEDEVRSWFPAVDFIFQDLETLVDRLFNDNAH